MHTSRLIICLLSTSLLSACSGGFQSSPLAGNSDSVTLSTSAPGSVSPAGATSPTPTPVPTPTTAVYPFGTSGTFVMGTLGDSISQAFDLSTILQSSPQYNFSSGAALSNSILNEFTTLFATNQWTATITGVDEAVVGDSWLASNTQMPAQVAALIAKNPNVVTIEFGANDICQGHLGTSTSAQLQSTIEGVLRSLTTSANPPQIIEVMSVPNIWQLTQIPGLTSNPVCQESWAILCPNLQVGQATFQAQWQEMNQALAAAAAAVGGPVIYDGGAVANQSFTQSEVSAIDCFHPSATGQAALATAVWPQILGATQGL